MGTFSIWHLLLIAVVVLVLFGGRGKLSDIMGDFAKGIKSFKKGLTDEEQPPQQPPRPIEHGDETKDKDNVAR
jgi:sec-independent protein translocase protein TatA